MTEEQKKMILAHKKLVDETLKAMGIDNFWAVPTSSTAPEKNENDEVKRDRTTK